MKQGHVLASRPVYGAVPLAAGGMTDAAAHGPAAHADQASDTVQANMAVSSAISLEITEDAFTLSGPPNTTVTELAAVHFRVTTNNAGGYTVGGRAADDALRPQTPGNPDTIPVSNLEVRPNGQTLWIPVTPNQQVTRNVDGPSAPGGDNYSTDYRVHIPNVRSDTYSVSIICPAATK
ncbi:hypothetical protein [Streptomyces sp. MS1.AVA.4]|uniref:Uncharacterized protein n=1 Tax=Streptomyces pratisoli TaxID=3139917 RepID=A0ACC6QUV1_9ACTN